jgi:hypothetical protein
VLCEGHLDVFNPACVIHEHPHRLDGIFVHFIFGAVVGAALGFGTWVKSSVATSPPSFLWVVEPCCSVPSPGLREIVSGEAFRIGFVGGEGTTHLSPSDMQRPALTLREILSSRLLHGFRSASFHRSSSAFSRVFFSGIFVSNLGVYPRSSFSLVRVRPRTADQRHGPRHDPGARPDLDTEHLDDSFL